jgi:Radical SAM superfamily
VQPSAAQRAEPSEGNGTNLAARAARRFEPRVAGADRGELHRFAAEIAAAHPQEGFEELSARLAARASHLLGAPMLSPASLDGAPLPVTRVERRLGLADELARFAPSEVADGRPVFEDPSPLDHETAIAWWQRYLARRGAGKAPPAIHFYAHVPFCRTRCDFCQCDSIVAQSTGEAGAYVIDLEAQAAAFARDLGRLTVETATIGGGTPSHLDEGSLRRVLAALVGQVFELVPGGYFSVELNPDSTTPGKLRILADAGVNRVSFGVQSFNVPTLQVVRRGYQTTKMTRDALSFGHAVPELQLALDLIAPLPREAVSSFERGVREAFDLDPHEIVLYRYQPVVRRGQIVDVGELSWDTAAGIFLEESERRGYQRFFHGGPSLVVRRPGARTFPVRYNQHTKEPSSMLGLGPFAESRVYGVGLYKSRGTGEDGPPYLGVSTPLARWRDAFVRQHLLTGSSIDGETFRRTFGEEIREAYGPELAYLEELGLVTHEAGQVVFDHERERSARHAWLFGDADMRARSRARAVAEEHPFESAAGAVGEAADWLASMVGEDSRGIGALLAGDGAPRLFSADAEVLAQRGRPACIRFGGVVDLEAALDGLDDDLLLQQLDRLRSALGADGETPILVRVLARLLACRALRDLRVHALRAENGRASLTFAASFASPSGAAVDSLLAAAGCDPGRLPGKAARDHAVEAALRIDPAGAPRLALSWRVDPERNPQWRRVQRLAAPPVAAELGRGRRLDYVIAFDPTIADAGALLVRELPRGRAGALVRLADAAPRFEDARVTSITIPCPSGHPDLAAAIVALARPEPRRDRDKPVSLLDLDAARRQKA